MKTDFQDFILYLKSEKIVAQNTLEAYERDLKSLLAFLTIKKISSWQQVSQEEIMQFLSERRAKDYAALNQENFLAKMAFFSTLSNMLPKNLF